MVAVDTTDCFVRQGVILQSLACFQFGYAKNNTDHNGQPDQRDEQVDSDVFKVILNGWLDIVFVPLEEIDSNQKASIRLVSSFYIILILLYIKFIYNDDNYDSLMMYFITLAVGRFIYFDFTMDDFLSTLHGFWEELPLLILMASYSGFVCWFGFYTGFLLTSNGVIVSTLLAHLFMVCSIFILDKTRVLRLVM